MIIKEIFHWVVLPSTCVDIVTVNYCDKPKWNKDFMLLKTITYLNVKYQSWVCWVWWSQFENGTYEETATRYFQRLIDKGLFSADALIGKYWLMQLEEGVGRGPFHCGKHNPPVNNFQHPANIIGQVSIVSHILAGFLDKNISLLTDLSCQLQCWHFVRRSSHRWNLNNCPIQEIFLNKWRKNLWMCIHASPPLSPHHFWMSDFNWLILLHQLTILRWQTPFVQKKRNTVVGFPKEIYLHLYFQSEEKYAKLLCSPSLTIIF